MPKVILEIHAQRSTSEPTLWARHVIINASEVPAKGERVIFQSTEKGNSDALSFVVTSKTHLASLDGYLIVFSVPERELAEEEWAPVLRKQLTDLGWSFVTPAPPLPFTADDDDDD